MKYLYMFFHWIAHLLRMNEGKVISWREKDNIFVGFECSGCKKIQGICKLKSSFMDEDLTKYKEEN